MFLESKKPLSSIKSLRAHIYGIYPNASDLNKVSAWVLIWYPGGDNIGHASVFIGGISEYRHYVSWWPTDGGKLINMGKNKAVTHSYESDVIEEDGHPDVVYGLFSLNVDNMEKMWWSIVSKDPEPSFIPLRKNCANIVKRIIKAGLFGNQFCPNKKFPFGFLGGGYYFWTPKRIAVVCNTLRDRDMAIKINLSKIKDSSSLLYKIIRLR